VAVSAEAVETLAGYLTEMAQSGDEAAAEAVVALFLPVARRLAAKFAVPGLDAEDVVQVAVLGILGAVRSYRPGGAPLEAYVRACAERSVISALRSATRAEVIPLGHADDDGELGRLVAAASPSDDPEAVVIGRETLQEIDSAMRAHLSEEERRVVVLRSLGFGNVDIARMTGESRTVVGWRLWRARQKLRQVLSLSF
jgi:RNA polymerase sigma factor (sigma-70 family)